MSTLWMPIFGERAAPTFDPAHSNELPRFFARLETLFDRCNVQNDLEKKTYATSYVDYELAEYWEALPEFLNASETYTDFRDRLLDIYHQRFLQYTASDLDRIVDDCAQISFHSLQHLADFHMQFNKVASSLASIGLLSLQEQSQTYLRAFDTVLSSRISIQLQVKNRNCSQTRPYTIDEIYDAAHWVLLDVLIQASSSNSIPLTSPTSSQNEPLEDIKTSEMSNCVYNVFHSEVPSFSASTSTLDFGNSSQDEADDRIAALEAELTALRAHIDADNYFDNFDASSGILSQNTVASSQNSYLPSRTSIPPLSHAIDPKFALFSSQINSDEEEQSECDYFDNFDPSSGILSQNAVASSQNKCLSPQPSTHSLRASIEPIFELTSNMIDSDSENAIISTLDLGNSSQKETDDRIAALEAELTALQAQIDSDEEEQPQCNNIGNFNDSSNLALRKPTSLTRKLCLLPRTSIPSLFASTEPNFEPVSDQTDLQKEEIADFDLSSTFPLRSSITSTQTLRRPFSTSVASLDSSIASISTQIASPVIQNSVYSSANSPDVDLNDYFELPLRNSIASIQYSAPSSQTSIPSIYTSTASNFAWKVSQTIQNSKYECANSSDMDFDDSFDPSLQESIHLTRTSLLLPQTSTTSLRASTESPVSNSIALNQVRLDISALPPQFLNSHRTIGLTEPRFEFLGLTGHADSSTDAISNFVASLPVPELPLFEYENIATSKAIAVASESNFDPLPPASNFISLTSTTLYTAFTASIKEFSAPASNRLALASPLVYIASDSLSCTSTHTALPLDLILTTLVFVLQILYDLPISSTFLLYLFVLMFLASVFDPWTLFRRYRYHLWPNKRNLRSCFAKSTHFSS